MSKLQSLLCAYEQNVITRNFNWDVVEGARGDIALRSPEAMRALARHGLEDMVANPGDKDFLNSLPFTELGSGSYGTAYEIEGTGLVVKKIFPDMYVGGYAGQDWRGRTHMKRLSSSTFLRDVAVNLALERALHSRKRYTTPQYLGHIILGNENGPRRHYTIMTKLERVDPESEADKSLVDDLIRRAHTACMLALRSSSRKIWFIDWDFGDAYGTNNVFPVLEEGEPAVGVIDQRTLFSRPKQMRGKPLISRRHHDPDAPWLPVFDPARLPATA